MSRTFPIAGIALVLLLACSRADDEKAGPEDNKPPAGFIALFNGRDLTNWKGLVTIKDRQKMSADELSLAQKKADELILPHWTVKDGILHYDGKGPKYKSNLQTSKDYGNFELLVDWKIEPKGDSGIYVRGNPQIQIWDTTEAAGYWKMGADKGSGGLWNNKKNPRDPSKHADRPIGQWNRFRILMKGDKVTVYLNNELVVDGVPLENYWEQGKPLPARGPIELQDHTDPLQFKNIYLKELAD